MQHGCAKFVPIWAIQNWRKNAWKLSQITVFHAKFRLRKNYRNFTILETIAGGDGFQNCTNLTRVPILFLRFHGVWPGPITQCETSGCQKVRINMSALLETCLASAVGQMRCTEPEMGFQVRMCTPHVTKMSAHVIAPNLRWVFQVLLCIQMCISTLRSFRRVFLGKA